MKQFILEEYLADPLKKVVTRDGRPVRIICTDARGEYPIIALVEYYDGNNDNIYSYTKDGVYYPIEPSEEDLFFASEAPKKIARWPNVYKHLTGRYGLGSMYSDKKTAKASIPESCIYQADYIATVKVEWEE